MRNRLLRALKVTLALLALSPGLVAAPAGSQPPAGIQPGGWHEMLVANPLASTGHCGVERWSVKTGTDADAGLVNLASPVPQSIGYLRGLGAPATPPANHRVQPTEITEFVVDATLVEYKLESDSDYHLVIADAQGNTMIAEIPDPACVGAGSPLAGGIQSARQQFDGSYTATTSFTTVNVPVRVTGVAMFDFLHGQTGVAPNGIELHPVLDIVFNPGTGGNPDFTLAAAPASLSLNQGASVDSTLTVAPANGFSGNVAFAVTGLPDGISATFNPPASPISSTLTLRATDTAATGPATLAVSGTAGTLSHRITLDLSVHAATGGSHQTAVYDPIHKAPACASVGSSCDSGTLLSGRDNLAGGAEPNQPNTLGGTCADGNAGRFHADESNDRLVIASTDGGPLTAGHPARITASLWAYSTADALDLYSAADAAHPAWVLLDTLAPPAAGAQDLSTTFVLPTGAVQAVRAHLRYGGNAAPCSSGAYDESDDLQFAVAAATPDFVLTASPASLSIAQGSAGSSMIGVTPTGGFDGSVALTASGVPAGVTAAFNPASTSGSSVLNLTAGSTAAAGAATLTITGNSGPLNHSTTLDLSVTPAGGGDSGSLQNGVAATALAASKGHSVNFTMAVPAGASNLTFALSGGSGDADLYVRFGAAPTTRSYDCRPYLIGNDETCTFATPQAGTWYVRVRAYASYSGVSLTGSYNP